MALRRTVSLPQVLFSQTTIASVRRGTLTLSRNGRQCTTGETQVIVIPGGQAFDLTYTTNRDGLYVADLLIPDPAIGRRPPPAEMATGEWLPKPIDVVAPLFRQSLERAMSAVHHQTELPDIIATHHMLEVFQWIDLHGGCGCAAFDTSISGRMWGICALEPSRDWGPDEVADRMGVSVYCLRSRLHAEGHSFSQLLHEIRMGHALSLLLATNMPIYAIAREIGYQSTSRFTVRFRGRYGLRPGDARGHDRPVQSRHFAPLMARMPAYAQQA